MISKTSVKTVYKNEYNIYYLCELDGLRALSVIFVVLMHVSYGNISGGFLGVDVFFVLSGYLITRLLCIERSKFGLISLPNFYIRRFMRIIPPLTVCVLLAWVLGTTPTYDFMFIAGAALFFVANFFSPEYLDNLAHTWSLAIEEQFYLVWPLIFILLSPRKSIVLLILVVCVAISARAMLLSMNYDANLIYSLTFTRMDSLSIGCLLALFERRLDAAIGSKLEEFANYSLSLCMILLFGSLLFLSRDVMQESFLAFSVFSFLSASTVYFVTRVPKRNIIRKLLSKPIIVWLGKRSYGIYLYHYPLYIAFETLRVPGNLINYVMIVLAIVLLSLLVAEISWRFVEKPISKVMKSKYSSLRR